jgi:hypothetical protein
MSMKIVEGGLPEDKAWRALILLTPGEEVGMDWQLGLSLARANNGELVAAIIVPSAAGALMERARTTLNHARKASALDDPVFTAIVEHKDSRQAIRQLVHDADIDLLLTTTETPRTRCAKDRKPRPPSPANGRSAASWCPPPAAPIALMPWASCCRSQPTMSGSPPYTSLRTGWARTN